MPKESLNRKIDDLKRSFTKPKSADDIYDEQLETAVEEYTRGELGLFLMAISGGLELGFSLFVMGIMYTLFFGTLSGELLHVLIALSYPAGFILVIIGKSVLFTEHKSLAVISVLNKKATIKDLLKSWGTIYSGNLLGGYIFSILLVYLITNMGTISKSAIEHIALTATDHKWFVILGSAVLAGWLMGLLSWLVSSAQETISRIFMIFLITFIIGIGSLHHSILGSLEVFTGVLVSNEISVLDYLNVQFFSTVGNIIGSVTFVAFLKHSIIQPNKKQKRKLHPETP